MVIHTLCVKYTHTTQCQPKQAKNGLYLITCLFCILSQWHHVYYSYVNRYICKGACGAKAIDQCSLAIIKPAIILLTLVHTPSFNNEQTTFLHCTCTCTSKLQVKHQLFGYIVSPTRTCTCTYVHLCICYLFSNL